MKWSNFNIKGGQCLDRMCVLMSLFFLLLSKTINIYIIAKIREYLTSLEITVYGTTVDL